MGDEAAIAGLTGIDWSSPDSVDDQGRRVFSVRCRVPFSVPITDPPQAVRRISEDGVAVDLSDTASELGVTLRDLSDIGHTGDGDPPARVLPDDGEGIILNPDATGDPGSDDEVAFTDPALVAGIASSTSVDFMGTEMSLRALKLMAVQMMGGGGIAYLPRHNYGLSGAVEWDEIIGRTVHAEVVPVEQVAKAFNEAEAQFILRATIRLYDDEPKAQALLRRVRRGEPIGQSIGGWFTNLQVMQNEDGDVERVVVQGVELDHLAVTRAPANPDSLGIVSLRSALQASAQEHRAQVVEACATVPPTQDDRHVVGVTDNGDGTASIVLAIADHDDEQDELYAGGKKKKRDALVTRTVTPFADLSMADPDLAWSWDTAAQNAVLGEPTDEPNWERYRQAHVWYDPEATDTRAGYKLPIAKMIDGDLKVVFRGVVAAMAAVNGARGGVNISDEERRRAYDHLARYYDKFDREPPSFQASALGGMFDNADATVQAASIDARRSATADDLSPTPANIAGAPSEEHAMNEHDLDALRDAMRSAVNEATAPLTERIAALETASEQRSVPTPEPTPEAPPVPTVDERVTAAERSMADAVARAEAAERALAEANRRPMRVGRSMVPSIPQGPSATPVANGLIERARTTSPTVAAVAERAMSIVTDADQTDTKVTRSQLERTLSDLLTAAESDGIITDPNHRAHWQ